MIRSGSLVISLDFELMWGIIEKSNASTYAKSNVGNVREVVKRMLDLFNKYQVKATFATVGFLMCKDTVEAMKWAPESKPSYTDKSLYPYGEYMEHIQKEHYDFYFAPDLVETLKQHNNVEIGTHTYCHYYCWEKGQTIEEFEDDIKSSVAIAKDRGLDLKSIIFPRNNVSDDYLAVCAKYNITSYRGNAKNFFSHPRNKFERYKNRLGRLLDAYINLGVSNSFDYSDLKPKAGLPTNIPASRIFRPYSHNIPFFETLRISRIKNEIKYAAKHGQMYHIWWHPHNFGANIDENMKNLECILQAYSQCKVKYGMQAYTLNELAEIINK